MGKNFAVSSLLLFHFGLVLFIGLVLCNWGFIGSLLVGVFSIIIGTAAVFGLAGPIAIIIMILAGLGIVNIFWIGTLITGAVVSACLVTSK